jgi:hypothetical protein
MESLVDFDSLVAWFQEKGHVVNMESKSLHVMDNVVWTPSDACTELWTKLLGRVHVGAANEERTLYHAKLKFLRELLP